LRRTPAMSVCRRRAALRSACAAPPQASTPAAQVRSAQGVARSGALRHVAPVAAHSRAAKLPSPSACGARRCAASARRRCKPARPRHKSPAPQGVALCGATRRAVPGAARARDACLQSPSARGVRRCAAAPRERCKPARPQHMSGTPQGVACSGALRRGAPDAAQARDARVPLTSGARRAELRRCAARALQASAPVAHVKGAARSGAVRRAMRRTALPATHAYHMSQCAARGRAAVGGTARAAVWLRLAYNELA
jgi:hypothetical protein